MFHRCLLLLRLESMIVNALEADFVDAGKGRQFLTSDTPETAALVTAASGWALPAPVLPVIGLSTLLQGALGNSGPPLGALAGAAGLVAAAPWPPRGARQSQPKAHRGPPPRLRLFLPWLSIREEKTRQQPYRPSLASLLRGPCKAHLPSLQRLWTTTARVEALLEC